MTDPVHGHAGLRRTVLAVVFVVGIVAPPS